MAQKRVLAIIVFLIGAALGWYVYSNHESGSRPFKLGLDLSGGTQLVYRADLNALQSGDIAESMAALRDTIERRVNLFGVSEPIVQTETAGRLAGAVEERLIVELPGITDTQKAIDLIGETPVLEFRMLKAGITVPEALTPEVINEIFEPAILTGKELSSAQLQFQNSGIANEPVVVLNFNAEGKKIFADVTAKNIGRQFGMFLDGQPISIPVIQSSIPDGTAVVSGNFTAEGAKELARNLNYGALPVPIELISTQTVSGTLGAEAVKDGVMAGVFGVIFVALFMLFWYRLPGLLSAFALLLYIVVNLALFQFIPVTLTAAGIAAFILSIGMAVDANVLIFERMKEELNKNRMSAGGGSASGGKEEMQRGKSAAESIHDGFARAWPSIRDSNISSMITAIILFWFGTSLVKGFALVFGLGVLVSMLTAITVSRTFLYALNIHASGGLSRFLFGSGLSK